jgi:hypothetical protein
MYKSTLKKILIIPLIGLCYNTFAQWIQIGETIFVNQGYDFSGTDVDITPDGKFIAIGARGAAGYQNKNGEARIYQLVNGTWVKVGSSIPGENEGDQMGYSIAISDNGKRVVAGEPANDNGDVDAGRVRVFEFDGTSWSQLGGDILGSASGEKRGKVVEMNADGSIIATGPYASSVDVKIYQFDGANWVQLGSGIPVVSTNATLALSPDGHALVIGNRDENTINGNGTGTVRVYSFNGTDWVQQGQTLTGEAVNDFMGYSVSISGGNSIVVGVPYYDYQGNNDAGVVRIYDFDGTSWVQRGNDIFGNEGDALGSVVNISFDGNVVAIGSPRKSDNGYYAGEVVLYKYVDSNWSKVVTFNGQTGDQAGSNLALSFSGDTIIYGSPNSNGAPYVYAGNAKVFTDCSSYSTISVEECESYTSPSAKYTWTISGVYQDTISNYMGCDSIITIDLTIKQPSYNTISETVCGNYTSPSGKYTWYESGTYKDTIPNAIGCDSIITIDLTVNQPSYSTDTHTACNSFTWIDGVTYTESNNTATYTLTNSVGCDSIVTLDLTILKSTSSSIIESACSSYTSPSGKYTWTEAGTYKDTIPNAAGCDSIITIDLTIKQPSYNTISETVCGNYTSPSGKYTWYESGTYKDTIPNAIGCDSIITIDLTVNQPSYSTDTHTACNSFTWIDGVTYTESNNTATYTLTNSVGCDSIVTLDLTILESTSSSISENACDSYTSPSGKYIWTESGTYKDTIPNAIGCDSVITINLVVTKVDVTVTQDNQTLTANQQGAAYQWLDCNNGHSEIPGETSQTFVATQNGSYAVRVEVESCVDTSDCYTVTSLDVSDMEQDDEVAIYPNPSSRFINIFSSESHVIKSIKLVNLLGETVWQSDEADNGYLINVSNFVKGTYLLMIEMDNRHIVKRVVIE